MSEKTLSVFVPTSFLPVPTTLPQMTGFHSFIFLGPSTALLCVCPVFSLFVRFLALCLVIVWEPCTSPDRVQGLGGIGVYNSIYFNGDVRGPLLAFFSAEGSPSWFRVALKRWGHRCCVLRSTLYTATMFLCAFSVSFLTHCQLGLNTG